MPLLGRIPLEVTFSDASTPSGDITYWHWDFGDGTTSNDQNPVHTYSTEGVFTVTLNVASAKGIDTYTDIVDTSLLASAIAYWKLDEANGSRADSVGPYSLTENGVVGAETGRSENCADFDGSNYLSNVNGPGLSNEMAVSLWVKVTALDPAQFTGIIGKDFNAGGEREWLIAMNEVGDTFAGAFGTDDGFVGAYFIPSTPPGDNDWHHLLFWIGSDDYLYVQKDGGTVVQSAATLNGRKGLTAHPFCIGWNGRDTFKLNGRVDEVAIFDYVPTADERERLFTADYATVV